MEPEVLGERVVRFERRASWYAYITFQFLGQVPGRMGGFSVRFAAGAQAAKEASRALVPGDALSQEADHE
ncbi:MAG: hypothetical protein DMF49_11875 [Acidobacteria bacterium]|nr:MAG: hypothetical protein DMF49_11875 [Acidobacteriota bacterium]